MKIFSDQRKFLMFFFLIFFLLNKILIAQPYGLNCTVEANGSTGIETCSFYANGSYQLEIDAYNIVAPCEYGGLLWYACSLYVKINGVTVSSTNGWLGQDTPWYYWSDFFKINNRDFVEINLIYETINFCIGNPIYPNKLTVIDGIHMGGGSPPSENLVESQSFSQLPFEFSLEQNYPNPFNPSTVIHYSISENQLVNLTVYDLLGNEVAILVNEYKEPGSHSIEFNVTDLSSGIYYYKLSAGDFVNIKKMIFVK
uniref:T9SS type A sorting domain-containing protein n=1 Tax=Ignavibacterium album TaxID=591197 RepID=A0A832DIC8_9BACT